MPGIHRISHHFRKYGLNSKNLYAISLMLLFWGIFDGIIAFITPILIIQNGISKSEMGLIIASTAIAGALFDLILSYTIKNHHYRIIFMYMFAICIVYPLILMNAKTVWTYLLAMATWGLFYNLKNFGVFDFVSRRTEKKAHASSFGIVSIFTSTGYMLAPIIAGLTIGSVVGAKSFGAIWLFLVISLIFFWYLLKLTSRDKGWLGEEKSRFKVNFLSELGLWHKLGNVVLPLLILVMFLNVIDSVFWTIGPILSEESSEFGHLSGLFLTVYQAPILLVGWFIGSFTSRMGKKRTAFYALIAGSLVLLPFGFISNPILLLFLVGVSSMFLAIAWPSIYGAFADYLSESPEYRNEIEGLEDFSHNLGYIIGPISAGILSDLYSDLTTFSALGIAGLFVAFLIVKITPNKINISKSIEP